MRDARGEQLRYVSHATGFGKLAARIHKSLDRHLPGAIETHSLEVRPDASYKRGSYKRGDRRNVTTSPARVNVPFVPAFSAFSPKKPPERWNEKTGLLKRHAVSCCLKVERTPEGCNQGDQLMSQDIKKPAGETRRYVGIDRGDKKSRVCILANGDRSYCKNGW